MQDSEDRITIRIPKEKKLKLRAKLMTQNKTVAQWINEEADKLLKK